MHFLNSEYFKKDFTFFCPNLKVLFKENYCVSL